MVQTLRQEFRFVDFTGVQIDIKTEDRKKSGHRILTPNNRSTYKRFHFLFGEEAEQTPIQQLLDVAFEQLQSLNGIHIQRSIPFMSTLSGLWRRHHVGFHQWSVEDTSCSVIPAEREESFSRRIRRQIN